MVNRTECVSGSTDFLQHNHQALKIDRIVLEKTCERYVNKSRSVSFEGKGEVKLTNHVRSRRDPRDSV